MSENTQIDYQEFVLLAALNLWVKEGLPQDYVVEFAASSSEGDPRGTLPREQCQKTFDDIVQKGWVTFGKASDDSDRIFAYSTEIGTAIFKKNKHYWIEQVKKGRSG